MMRPVKLELERNDIEMKALSKCNVDGTQRDFKTLTGIALIIASYIFCWPLIGLLGIFSAYLERPLIISVGGPAVYAFSYLLLFVGVYLAGKKYAKLIFDWFKYRALRLITIN